MIPNQTHELRFCEIDCQVSRVRHVTRPFKNLWHRRDHQFATLRGQCILGVDNRYGFHRWNRILLLVNNICIYIWEIAVEATWAVKSSAHVDGDHYLSWKAHLDPEEHLKEIDSMLIRVLGSKHLAMLCVCVCD